MLKKTLRIATHRSPLARMYTETIVLEIQQLYPDIHVEVVWVATDGDRFCFAPLPDWGGKSLYMHEVDESLFMGKADIAVHVVEERYRHGKRWPLGWLAMLSPLDTNNALYFFINVKRLPRFFPQLF